MVFEVIFSGPLLVGVKVWSPVKLPAVLRRADPLGSCSPKRLPRRLGQSEFQLEQLLGEEFGMVLVTEIRRIRK